MSRGERIPNLESGLREILDRMLAGYVDSETIVRLRRLVGIQSADTIVLSETRAPAALDTIVADPEKYTLKRAAWAYGCAAKGSEIEAALLAVLLKKANEHEIRKLCEGITITPDLVEPGRVHVTIPMPSFDRQADWMPTSRRSLNQHPVPLGKPIIQERPKPNPSWWSNTSCSSRSSSEAPCHPGDKCHNYPSCESCGPARQ